MRILVSNDDGIAAPGLRALVSAAREFGEVRVVAPDRERSACGHAMTMREPLRSSRVHWDDGIEAYAVNGFPVDCVNIGLSIIWQDGCDLVLSGINAGPNLGFDVTYSGTVGAAMEGAISGIRSIAVSMASFVSGAPLHFDTATQWLSANLGALVSVPNEALTFLNVNVPNVEFDEIRGTKAVPLGRRIYEERIEPRMDPWGQTYYWQGGVQVLTSDQPGTDVAAVSERYVSVTPITLDWTACGLLDAVAAQFKS